MPNLPTHVRLPPESPLNPSQAKEIVLSSAAVGDGPATEAQLERWWVLATDPDHVRSGVDQLPWAWDGAIEFLKRMRQR